MVQVYNELWWYHLYSTEKVLSIKVKHLKLKQIFLLSDPDGFEIKLPEEPF